MTNTDKSTTELLLLEAYEAEVTTALNYLALSNSLEGVRGEMVADRLRDEVEEEFNHAQRIADHLDTHFGILVPRPDDLALNNPGFPQPSYRDSSSGVEQVIDAVVTDEEAAIKRYRTLVSECQQHNSPTTRRLAEELLDDEIEHQDEFESLKQRI